MSYSRDFDSVHVSGDGTTLSVNATSIDNSTGKPGSKDPATSFTVALAKAPAGGICHVSESVKSGVGGAWAATFRDAAPDFLDNPDVFIIGIAYLQDCPPYVWHETNRITTRTGEPFGQS